MPAGYLQSGIDFSRLAWGADAASQYAEGDIAFSNTPMSRLTVSSGGGVFDQAVANNIFLGLRPHFDSGTRLLYGDGGEITQPSELASLGNFQAPRRTAITKATRRPA